MKLQVNRGKDNCNCQSERGRWKDYHIDQSSGIARCPQQKSLLVDLDPQGNSSTGLGIDRSQLTSSLYDVLGGVRSLLDVLNQTELNDLFIVPSTKDLVGAEIELVAAERREYRIKDALVSVHDHYDYIFLDCPPSLGLLTVNALTAADSLLVPIQSEYYALEGLSALLETMNLVQRGLNSKLHLEGIVITMFDGRNRISHQVVEEVRSHFPDKLFRTIIRRNVRLSESPSYGKPIYLYDANSTGSQDYLDLAKELMSHGEINVTTEKGLGRGLSALIPGASEPRIETDSEAVSFRVEVDRITPSPFQPRRTFDEAKIEELASSIRNQGIIQPLVVRRNGDGYELIAGERRWRAAMRAGLTHVPIVVRDASDHEALQLALVENLQREDLNPIEEANGYRRLLEEFHWSQEEMAEKVGKSRPAITNSMRLLSLPTEVQQEVSSGNLPAGQARALLGLHNEPLILSACREVIAKGLSTRDTEKLVRHLTLGRKRRRVLACRS